MENIDIGMLCDFAKLDLTTQEKDFYTKSLQKSLSRLSALDKIDCKKAFFQNNTVNFQDLRSDTPFQNTDTQKIVQMAKNTNESFICVPKVIEQER